MNRNLKRVLALALTLTVMAVNFVIPAMASASITVSYTDLLTYGGLLQRQGELYYETSAGNANANSGLDSSSNKNKAYAPLEVWSSATNAGLNIVATEWVRFEVEAPVAGYYSVDMNAAVGAQNGTYVYIRTEKSIIEKELAKTGNQYGYKDITDLGYVYLEEGLNHIYVDNKGGSYINFRTLTLTLDEEADTSMVKWLVPVEGISESEDLTVSYDDGYNQAEVSTVTYEMNIPVDGKYKVSVMGKASGDNHVSADFGSDVKTATVNNTEYEYTDLAVFPLTEGEYTLTLNGFTAYSLAWAKVEYVSPYETSLDSESFSDGDTVARDTDNLTLIFNDVMKDTVAATLTVGGVEVPVAVDVDGANVIVSFLETLDYETEYTLEVTGLRGANDETVLEDRTYTFTTGDYSSDDALDAVEVTEVESRYEAVTIKGIAYGSTGHGIKGRIVTVTSPDGEEVATVTSGDDGAFTAEFNIAEGTVANAYTYTVISEYGASANALVGYVSEEDERIILGLFANADTPDDVKAILAQYGAALLIPEEKYQDDFDTLTEQDVFYHENEFDNVGHFLQHFQQATFTSVKDVAPAYDEILLLEKLNQATSIDYIINNYFSKPEVCEALFPAYIAEKIDFLSDVEKEAVAACIAGEVPVNTAAYFVYTVEYWLDVAILIGEEVAGTGAKIAEEIPTTIYENGAVHLPIKFTVPQDRVYIVCVYLKLDPDFIGTRSLDELESFLTCSTDSAASRDEIYVEWYDQEAMIAACSFMFDASSDKKIEDIGDIYLTAPATTVSDCAFEIDAVGVGYRIQKTKNEKEYDIRVNVNLSSVTLEDDVTEPSFNVSVIRKPTTSPQRPASSGGSSGGGGGGYVAPPKEKVEETDENTSKYFFDDVADDPEIQDMVQTLAAKGIIAQPEDKKFRPLSDVTREEVVKMLVNAIGSHKASAVSDLADVPAGHWATSYIATAQELGIVKGYADGTFGLGKQVTRQDLTVMVYRTFQLLGINMPAGNATFNDSAIIADYAKTAVLAMEKIGAIGGLDGNFAPGVNATRAQTAKIIYVMMEVLDI